MYNTVQRHVEAYLSRLITISRKPEACPPSKQKASKPAEDKPAATLGTTVPPPTSEPPKSNKADSSKETNPPRDKEDTRPPTPPSHEPDNSSLAAALKAKKGKLKPTEVSATFYPFLYATYIDIVMAISLVFIHMK